MPNSDNEAAALLPPSDALDEVNLSQNVSEDETSTATTTLSDEENFESCESGSNPFGELANPDEDQLNKEVAEDPHGSDKSLSDAESLPIDRDNEVPLCKAEGVHSSSEDSKGTSRSASSVDLGCVIEYRSDEAGNVEYVEIDFNTSIADKDMIKLMKKLRLNHYTAVSCEGDFTLSKCRGLFERDYQCEMIDNTSGRLSRHYPPRILVPVAKHSSTASCASLNSLEFDAAQYTERVKKSVSSRLRTRFVAPVILFDNKFICRSGTLTVRKSAVFETVTKSEPPKSIDIATCAIQRAARSSVKLQPSFNVTICEANPINKRFLASTILHASSRGCKATSQLLIPSAMEKLRDEDAQIIRDLKIQHICDLMIEDRKMFKQVIRVSSSEKINKDIYCDCSIEQMPYPGCKLFQRYYEASHVPERIVFDWNRPDVNSEMMFSEDPSGIFPDINWSTYKEWDLVDLTKNYLRMLLYYLAKGDGGLLVHCISGWDRTPLFISILRVSLWADGVIHESLAYREMAYLTLAYDWYLFGHDLPNRLRKKQEIMHFCFKFLPYIISDDFSITRIFHQLPSEHRGDRVFPKFEPGRRERIHFLSVYVLGHYFEHITEHME